MALCFGLMEQQLIADHAVVYDETENDDETGWHTTEWLG
jgi:hypothetical protein